MRKLFYLLTLIAVGASFGCSANTSVNSGNANTTKMANTNTASSTPAATPVTETKAGSMATPTETYKTAYAYRKNGDINGLKKVMSKEVLEFLTEMGKMDNKTLDDMLQVMVKKPQAATDDSRNEKITGDRATLEHLEKDGTWTMMDFVREGSEWKITLPGEEDDKKELKK